MVGPGCNGLIDVRITQREYHFYVQTRNIRSLLEGIDDVLEEVELFLN